MLYAYKQISYPTLAIPLFVFVIVLVLTVNVFLFVKVNTFAVFLLFFENKLKKPIKFVF